MKSVLFSTLMLVCGTFGLFGAKPAKATVPDTQTSAQGPYTIGPGDVLQINVYHETEASVPSVAVRSDGVISVPLVKEVSAGGLTPKQLEAVLTEKLSKYIRDADVTVIVKEVHSEKVFLIGGVRKEGAVVMSGPMTVLQAISASGGFTDYAKRKKIYILRQEGDKQTRLPFDYDAVIKGTRPEANIVLRPGDTVVVPQ